MGYIALNADKPLCSQGPDRPMYNITTVELKIVEIKFRTNTSKYISTVKGFTDDKLSLKWNESTKASIRAANNIPESLKPSIIAKVEGAPKIVATNAKGIGSNLVNNGVSYMKIEASPIDLMKQENYSTISKIPIIEGFGGGGSGEANHDLDDGIK